MGIREIIFRAKRKDNGQWAQGSLFAECSRVEIVRGTCNNIGIEGVEVIPETIGQYTGLTDKNGKKIFEGDIIKEYGYENIYHIEYCDYYKYPAFDCDPEVTGCDCNGLSYLANAEIIEVIGNIHDNPELLEVK